MLACPPPAAPQTAGGQPAPPERTPVARLPHPLLLAVALVALALPAAAAASGQEAILDCSEDDRLDGSYSKKELRWARDNLPTDLDEYSSCREVFSSALASLSNPGGPGGKAASATEPGSAEEKAARAGDQRSLDRLTASRDNPGEITVGGSGVSPGENGLFDVASASNDLPLPLILALIGLALLTLAAGFAALRPRVPLLARIPLPSRGWLPRRRG